MLPLGSEEYGQWFLSLLSLRNIVWHSWKGEQMIQCDNDPSLLECRLEVGHIMEVHVMPLFHQESNEKGVATINQHKGSWEQQTKMFVWHRNIHTNGGLFDRSGGDWVHSEMK